MYPLEAHSSRAKSARGVQIDEVWAAADAVLHAGLRPTIERVRAQLGRGSPNTVAPMLEAWYAALGKRLSSVDCRSDNGSGDDVLPEAVKKAALDLWAQARLHAAQAEQSAQQHIRQALEAKEDALQAERVALNADRQVFEQKAEALAGTIEAKNQQIETLLSQQVALSEESKRLKDLNEQLRRSADALRQHADVMIEQHRLERAQLEERAVAQERRLLTELDQARQAAKRTEKALADEQRSFNASKASLVARLASQQAQIDQDRTLLGQLQRELSTSKAAAMAAESQIEQLQRSTALQLNALNRKIDRKLEPPLRIKQARIRGSRTSLQPTSVRRK